MGFADPPQPRPPAPHLQVNVPHPLEYPLVGPDHGVYVLCLAAGAALLEGLVGGDNGSAGGGARRGSKERASMVLGGPRVLVQGGVLTSEPWVLWPCQSGAWPFIVGNGEKPAPGGGGLGETPSSCLVCISKTPSFLTCSRGPTMWLLHEGLSFVGPPAPGGTECQV